MSDGTALPTMRKIEVSGNLRMFVSLEIKVYNQ
jgi:hypothetical protein